ncbi:MAG: hypothetical protein R2911_17095 [Caldilineaceae bacterium]
MTDATDFAHIEDIESPAKLYLTGPFGADKTTLAIQRIQWLLRQERTRGDQILVLAPQRTLAQPYYDALRGPGSPPGPPVHITTLAGLARNALTLYWPLLASAAEFSDPTREPTFLNLETSQYHMAHFVDRAIAQADFDGIRIERSRVISQVLDNLNKTALNGFNIDEAYERLELAVPGGEQRTARLNALRAARRISHEFRQLCLDETLIDFSLQIELFNRHVLTNEWSRTHLFRTHRHLIFDNSEEDTVTAHNLAQLWIPQADSALVIVDANAGYRVFLGADPLGAHELAAVCDARVDLTESHVMSPELVQLTGLVRRAIGGEQPLHAPSPPVEDDDIIPFDDDIIPFDDEAIPSETEAPPFDDAALGDTLPSAADQPAPTVPSPSEGQEEGQIDVADLTDTFIVPQTIFRFYPQMIDWTAAQVRRLVQEEGVAPDQIAILAPFISDALRFSLQTRLEEVGIASTTHRPSRALQDEPAARALLTLAALAHPDWGIRPAPSDVTMTLVQTVNGLDPVRAHLLSRVVFPPRGARIDLGRFGELIGDMQQRITFTTGEHYDRLRDWMYDYRASAHLVPLDQFFAQLFGEVLSQEGFGFHDDYDAARVANQLVESARNFRWALEEGKVHERQKVTTVELGREYLRLVESGALGALYAPGWREVENAVFLAPAYTFLMRNRAVDVQFWLDIGAGGWWERLYQPLTHPYVLSSRWPANLPWSDADETRTRQETMRRLLLGLIHRTRQRIYLGMSDYSESGFEQRGPLLMLINRLLVQ